MLKEQMIKVLSWIGWGIAAFLFALLVFAYFPFTEHENPIEITGRKAERLERLELELGVLQVLDTLGVKDPAFIEIHRNLIGEYNRYLNYVIDDLEVPPGYLYSPQEKAFIRPEIKIGTE